MSGETEGDVSGWTVDTLHSHISRLLDERDRRYAVEFHAAQQAVEAAFAASNKAIDKAEAAQQGKNASQNEFRAQLSDQAGRLLERREAEARFEAVAERIDTRAAAVDNQLAEMKTRLTEIEAATRGRIGAATDLRAIVGLVIAVVSIAVTILIATR